MFSRWSPTLISLDDPFPKHVREKDSQPVKNIKIAGDSGGAG